MEKIQDSLELGLCQVPCNKVNEEGAQGISEGDLGPGVKGVLPHQDVAQDGRGSGLAGGPRMINPIKSKVLGRRKQRIEIIFLLSYERRRRKDEKGHQKKGKKKKKKKKRKKEK